MAGRLSFEELVNGAGPLPATPAAVRQDLPSGPSKGEASGDIYMMIFAGETWKIVSSEAAAAGMSPEAMVSRAIAEFVDRRRRAKEIPAQPTARVTHKVEKLR